LNAIQNDLKLPIAHYMDQKLGIRCGSVGAKKIKG